MGIGGKEVEARRLRIPAIVIAFLCSGLDFGHIIKEPSHGGAERFPYFRRNSIAQLAGHVSPRACADEIIGKALKASHFSNREIPYAPVRQGKHILASRDTVGSCFQCLCGFVRQTTRVVAIRARTWMLDMVGIVSVLGRSR